MILDIEVKKEFTNILEKSQAFQICASAVKPTDCRKTQAELVGMYRFLNMGNIAEFELPLRKRRGFLVHSIISSRISRKLFIL